MVIKASKSFGFVCEARSSALEAGEFKLAVDPEENNEKNNDRISLTLKTATKLPFFSYTPLNLIQGAGDYEVSDVKILGIPLDKESDTKRLRTVYVVTMDGMNLFFPGDVKVDLGEDFLEDIGEIDLFFVSGEADIKETLTLIKNIEPKIVICGSDKNIKDLSGELGQSAEPMDKVSFKKKDIAAAPSNMYIKILLNWEIKIIKRDLRSFSGMIFNPYSLRRVSMSRSNRPSLRDFKTRKTSPKGMECHC